MHCTIKKVLVYGVLLILALASCPIPQQPPNVGESRVYNLSLTGEPVSIIFIAGEKAYTPPEPQLYTLRNEGDQILENITLTLSGSGSGDFSIIDAADEPVGALTLEPGESKRVRLVFPTDEPAGKLYNLDLLAICRKDDKITGGKCHIQYGAFEFMLDPEIYIGENHEGDYSESSLRLEVSEPGPIIVKKTEFDMEEAAGRFKWLSSDPAVAEVDPVTGALALKSAGETIIGLVMNDYEEAAKYSFEINGKKLVVWDLETLPPSVTLKPGTEAGEIVYDYSAPRSGTWTIYIAKGVKLPDHDFTSGSVQTTAIAGGTGSGTFTGLTAGHVYSARILETGGQLRTTAVVRTVARTTVNAFYLRLNGSLDNELQTPGVRNLYAPGSGDNVATPTGATTTFKTGLRSGEQAINLSRQQFIRLDDRAETSSSTIVTNRADKTFDYTNSFTLAFWIRLRSTLSSAVDPPIFSNKLLGSTAANGPWSVGTSGSNAAGNTANFPGFAIYYRKSDSTIRLHVSPNGVRLGNTRSGAEAYADYQISSAPMPTDPDTDDNWIHIAVVFEKNTPVANSTVKYYANGTLVATQTADLFSGDGITGVQGTYNACAIIGNSVRSSSGGQMYTGYSGNNSFKDSDLNFLMQDFLLIPEVLDADDITALGTR